jgi:hypothetical protein
MLHIPLLWLVYCSSVYVLLHIVYFPQALCYTMYIYIALCHIQENMSNLKLTDGSPRFGQLLSAMFARSWPVDADTDDTAALEHALDWKFMDHYLTLHRKYDF